MSKDEVSELANKLNVKRSDVETMEQRLYCTDLHAETVAKDERASEKLALEIVSEGSDPYEDLMLDELKNRREKELKQAISTLDERTKDIIFSRWLKTPKDTLSELANRHGVSEKELGS